MNDDTISLTPPDTPQTPVAARRSYNKTAPKAPSAGVWLTTFTDTIALMLTFFVMTYSMSNPKQEIWEDIKEEINMESSKNLGQALQRGEVNDINLEKVNFERALDLSYLEALLTNQLAKRELNDKVFILSETDTNRLILTVPQKFLFASGHADIIEQNKIIIKQLSSILKGIKNSIEIVGHTDPDPISESNTIYQSNWDLSLQRALNVAKELRDGGYTSPLHVRGSSSSLYHSLPKSLPENERMALSRRVDIVIYDKQENFTERLGMK